MSNRFKAVGLFCWAVWDSFPLPCRPLLQFFSKNSNFFLLFSESFQFPRSQFPEQHPNLLDSMIYYLTSGVFCYAKRSTKQTIYARIQKMNSTPFVRQYDIRSNKWGAVQQKTLRGFYYVVGVDACHRPAGGCKHSPLQFTMQSIRRSAPHAGPGPLCWRPARAG